MHASFSFARSFADQKSFNSTVGSGSVRKSAILGWRKQSCYGVVIRLKQLAEFAIDANGWLDRSIGKLDLRLPDKMGRPIIVGNFGNPRQLVPSLTE